MTIDNEGKYLPDGRAADHGLQQAGKPHRADRGPSNPRANVCFRLAATGKPSFQSTARTGLYADSDAEQRSRQQ